MVACRGRSGLAHGFAVELDAVGTVEQAVNDGIGKGRLSQASCQRATGSWLVTMVERRWTRSSITSKRDR